MKNNNSVTLIYSGKDQALVIMKSFEMVNENKVMIIFFKYYVSKENNNNFFDKLNDF